MLKLWQFMEQDCCSTQKKTLRSQETAAGIPHYHLGISSLCQQMQTQSTRVCYDPYKHHC